MKNVAIFEDGKGSRGSLAKLIKRGNKRVLIEFIKYNYETEEDEIVTEWFKLHIPSYTNVKKPHKHNNKRKQANYIHEETNELYSDYYQTEEYILEFRSSFNAEYADEVYPR